MSLIFLPAIVVLKLAGWVRLPPPPLLALKNLDGTQMADRWIGLLTSWQLAATQMPANEVQ